MPNRESKLENVEPREVEVMPMPEVEVRQEPNAQLLSVVFQVNNPDWGNESEIADSINDLFVGSETEREIKAFLQEADDSGFDEESLYVLALVKDNPKRKQTALDFLGKHKPMAKDPDKLAEKLFGLLDVVKARLSGTEEYEKLNAKIKESQKRLGDAERERKRIKTLIDFFRPLSSTSSIARVILVPEDPLCREERGKAFVFGGEVVIMPDYEEPGNLDHEFLHSIINSVVEKTSDFLDEDQRLRIVELSSQELKKDYGELHQSLLQEEIIRTYVNFFAEGNKPPTFGAFKDLLDGLDEKHFSEMLSDETSRFGERCAELGIRDLETIRKKARQYFNRFIKNSLRDIVFKLFEDYSSIPKGKGVDFETFFLKEFPNSI